MTSPVADAIDARLLRALIRDPRATTIALADEINVSRNTVQARLARLQQRGALRPFDRRVDPAFVGYPMQAVVLTRVKQRMLDEVAASLEQVREVIEVQGLSGTVDLLVRVVARDADDLYRVAGQILEIKGVRRTRTALVMRGLVDYRVGQLIDTAGGR
ncbi:MAG: Lrp/AsnC family transcriptional regulator [Actinobacteria bacterium]|nr:Lrp/AsnC family transcriptional regulator [Actinomycetota bacterium]